MHPHVEKFLLKNQTTSFWLSAGVAKNHAHSKIFTWANELSAGIRWQRKGCPGDYATLSADGWQKSVEIIVPGLILDAAVAQRVGSVSGLRKTASATVYLAPMFENEASWNTEMNVTTLSVEIKIRTTTLVVHYRNQVCSASKRPDKITQRTGVLLPRSVCTNKRKKEKAFTLPNICIRVTRVYFLLIITI